MERIIEKVGFNRIEKPTLKRVAAYARVSTGKDAMLHSLSAQVSYYSQLIQNTPGWLYCGVYSDEALTGTKDNREQFQRLLRRCRAGAIDMIITKSISRFARNTVTLLTTVRELKDIDVDVYFEEQNIHTMSADGELMLTIMASYAQEESLSASENQKWRIRKGFENGELMGLRFLYGYDINRGVITVNSDRSKIVREIFTRVADGEKLNSIARDLNERQVLGVRGGYWNTTRIQELVHNEKYLGNALLQKTFINNHIEKKKVKNKGECNMYYAEDTHDAIIDEDLYNRAQNAIKEINEAYAYKSKPKTSEFTSFIVCEKCGRNYRRTGKTGNHTWSCSTFLSKGKEYCRQSKIPESTLYSITADVIGKAEFTADDLHNTLIGIYATEHTLTYKFINGKTETRTWNFRSRSEIWTEEMKEQARLYGQKARH